MTDDDLKALAEDVALLAGVGFNCPPPRPLAVAHIVNALKKVRDTTRDEEREACAKRLHERAAELWREGLTGSHRGRVTAVAVALDKEAEAIRNLRKG